MTTAMTFAFEGSAVSFAERTGEWWASSDEVADALGYASRRQIIRVFGRHEHEFMTSESCVVTSTPQVGQARAVRYFSPKGVEHLAILGRTEKCVRFRRWLLDVVLPALREGPSLLMVVEQLRGEVAGLKATQAALLDISSKQASAMASVLGRRGAQKKLEKKAIGAIERSQRLLVSDAHPIVTVPDRPSRVRRSVNRITEN